MSRFPDMLPVNGSDGPLFMDGWDTGKIGNRQLPGKCKITSGAVKVKHDPKKKAGSDGARPTFHGLDGQPFEVEVMMWTQAHIDELADVLDEILPAPGTILDSRSPALAVDFPWIKHLRSVVNMVVTGASALEGQLPGPLKCKIHLLHWLPQGNAKTSVTSTAKKALRKINLTPAFTAQANPLPSSQPGVCGPPSGGASASF